MSLLGLGVGTVHVHIDQPLARRLKISSIPAFVAIVNGKPVHYNQRQFSIVLLREFVRNLVPSSIVKEVSQCTIVMRLISNIPLFTDISSNLTQLS